MAGPPFPDRKTGSPRQKTAHGRFFFDFRGLMVWCQAPTGLVVGLVNLVSDTDRSGGRSGGLVSGTIGVHLREYWLR
jgi:hypothetical protein